MHKNSNQSEFYTYSPFVANLTQFSFKGKIIIRMLKHLHIYFTFPSSLHSAAQFCGRQNYHETKHDKLRAT